MPPPTGYPGANPLGIAAAAMDYRRQRADAASQAALDAATAPLAARAMANISGPTQLGSIAPVSAAQYMAARERDPSIQRGLEQLLPMRSYAYWQEMVDKGVRPTFGESAAAAVDLPLSVLDATGIGALASRAVRAPLKGMARREANRLAGLGQRSLVDPAQRGMFVPPRGRNASQRVAAADEYASAGVSDQDIWRTTGLWRITPEHPWMDEISDEAMKLGNIKELPVRNIKGEPYHVGKLGDILEHDELFKLDPTLKDIEIRVSTNPRRGYGAAYHPRQNYLRIDAHSGEGSIKAQLAHELQHAVQSRNEWMTGASLGEYADDFIGDPGVADVIFRGRPEAEMKAIRGFIDELPDYQRADISKMPNFAYRNWADELRPEDRYRWRASMEHVAKRMREENIPVNVSQANVDAAARAIEGESLTAFQKYSRAPGELVAKATELRRGMPSERLAEVAPQQSLRRPAFDEGHRDVAGRIARGPGNIPDRYLNLMDPGYRATRQFMGDLVPDQPGRAYPDYRPDVVEGLSRHYEGVAEARQPAGFQAPRERAMGEVVGGIGTVPARPRLGNTQFRAPRERTPYPGIYGNPRDIIADVNVAPEDPALGRLFGVTREDLSRIALGRPSETPGWRPSATPRNPKGSAAAEALMTPSNERRIGDILEASRDRPELFHGMTGWYVHDPLYRQMVEQLGEAEATRRFNQMNSMFGFSSPGSNVVTEINRGSRADWLAERGRFGEFIEHGTSPYGRFPDDPEMHGMLGHPYSSTAHVPSMREFLENPGSAHPLGRQSKVPSYITAARPPGLGGQSHYAVGDAHWARGVGLADVRQGKAWGKNASVPEMTSLAPWYRDIALKQGMEAVPAQGVQWGALSRQTGVDTPVGAPKLELIAQAIMRTAQKTGRPPAEVRDAFIRGDLPIGAADPLLLKWMGGASAGALVAPLAGKLRGD